MDSQSVTGAERTSEKLTVELDHGFATVALCFNKDSFVSLVVMFEEDSGNRSATCGLEAGTPQFSFPRFRLHMMQSAKEQPHSVKHVP